MAKSSTIIGKIERVTDCCKRFRSIHLFALHGHNICVERTNDKEITLIAQPRNGGYAKWKCVQVSVALHQEFSDQVLCKFIRPSEVKVALEVLTDQISNGSYVEDFEILPGSEEDYIIAQD